MSSGNSPPSLVAALLSDHRPRQTLDPAMTSKDDLLAQLPTDLLVDSLLPTFAPRDLASLSRTSRAWRIFLTDVGSPCEILWQRKAARDFRFPVHASGRRTGWWALYSRLAVSAAMQSTNGRLGFPSHRQGIPASIRSLVIGDALPVPTSIELPASPVSIDAGGWSFHALSADGQVISWGQLDGGLFAADNAPLHDAGRIVRPMLLPQMDTIGAVAQLVAGRGHAVMLSEDGRVWEMRAFGRLVEVRDESRRWGVASGSDTAATLVQAGWDYSAVLTAGGAIYIWWGLPPALCDQGAAAAGENDLAEPSKEGVAFSVDLDTVKLPPLSASSSPHENDRIALISCGDDFMLALTKAGRLFYLDLSPVPAAPGQRRVPPGADRTDPFDSPIRSRENRNRLEAAFMSGTRSWIYLSKFCEFGGTSIPGGANPARSTRITHISAHFESFAAYSVPLSSDPAGSIVLLGKKGFNAGSEPIVLPELQDAGIIKVVHGDYHNLALTSQGTLLSWGAYSAGALGLGHPQLSNTPLSAPSANATPANRAPTEPAVARPYPLPQFGDVALPPPPQALFPGFVPGRPSAPLPRPPDRVEKPTRVRFHGERADDSEPGSRSRFVYDVTASGWHSGCLAVEASVVHPPGGLPTRQQQQQQQQSAVSSSGQEADEPIRLIRPPTTAEENASRAQAADEESLNGSRGWMGRLGTWGPFRVGFAGRGGVARGGGGAGLTRGSARGI